MRLHKQVSIAFTIAFILALVFSGSIPADEIYHMEQCRVLDTRAIGPGLPVANGTEYSFKVRGQVGHLQGGTLDCGVPIESSGAMLSITAIPNGPGHLEVYPLNERPPQPTSRLNYSFGGVAIANEILVRLHQPINTLIDEITVRPAVASTHLIVDLIAWTGEANPTFPIVRGRVFGSPFQAGGFTHVKVETQFGGDCSDLETCPEIECSNQPGAGEVCFGLLDGECAEIQGYRRPYSSPRWFEEHNRRMIATIVRAFPAPCPWE